MPAMGGHSEGGRRRPRSGRSCKGLSSRAVRGSSSGTGGTTREASRERDGSNQAWPDSRSPVGRERKARPHRCSREVENLERAGREQLVRGAVARGRLLRLRRLHVGFGGLGCSQTPRYPTASTPTGAFAKCSDGSPFWGRRSARRTIAEHSRRASRRQYPILRTVSPASQAAQASRSERSAVSPRWTPTRRSSTRRMR
jgi:hypothetical protein